VELLGMGLSTVHRTREQFVEEGLAASHRPIACTASSTAPARLNSSRSPARRRPRAASPGRCSCWPTNWWNCRWWSRSAKKRSAPR
jgi:hypothetical protein